MASEAIKWEHSASSKQSKISEGTGRRFGLMVSASAHRFEGIATDGIGIGIGKERGGILSKERTTKAMVSAIRNKQRKREVESLKARTLVQGHRQNRHRKAGITEI